MTDRNRMPFTSKSTLLSTRFASLIAASLLLVLTAGNAAAQGQGEINQALIDAQGGFPFVIDTPGSYILTSFVRKPASAGAVDAIRIESDDVTLDLRGFAVAGDVVCTRNDTSCAVTCSGGAPGVGINVRPGSDRVTVRNGSVHGFFTGVNASGRDIEFSDLTVVDNAFNGILTAGQGATIRRAIVYRNGDNGIAISNGGLVEDSTIAFNDNAGILADPNGLITGNSISENGGNGISTIAGTTFIRNGLVKNCTNPPVLGGTDGGLNACSNAAGTVGSCQ